MPLMNSMKDGAAGCDTPRVKGLPEAARDFRYLLNRGYPRKASLELAGNRYQLCAEERHLLHRAIFSDRDSTVRAKKIVPLKEISNQALAIDGYNVLITVEAALRNHPLILGDDGFVRDISGTSGAFKRTDRTDQAIRLILRTLKKANPRQILFLFDAPISRSGELAREVKARMKKEDLAGKAEAVPVPEKTLIGFRGIVATSDTALIDQSERVTDLAGFLIKRSIRPGSFIHLSQRSRS